MVIAINSYAPASAEFMTRYLDFDTGEEPDYLINIWPHQKLASTTVREDDSYFYNVVTFDEKFYYRHHKHAEVLDVILPATFKFWEIDNFLKLFFSSRCLNHGTILLHASGIIRDDKVVLFTAPSGTGKSTIAGLSGCPIIHDDIIALEQLPEQRFRLYTIPFKVGYKAVEHYCSQIDLYRIYQSADTFIEETSSPEQLAILLFGLWSFDHFHRGNSREYNQMTLAYCHKLVPFLNPRKLFFSLGSEFIPLLS